MENEYGITVTNKYSLFLSGDEDLLQVLQRELESKPASKKEKQKKAPGKEKEVKLPQSTQSGNEQPKVESVDQFTSPTSGDGTYVGIIQEGYSWILPVCQARLASMGKTRK